MKLVKKQVLAAAVSTCLAVGAVVTPAVAVFANSIQMSERAAINLADGVYTVDINILKETTDSASSAASYFTTKDVTLVVTEGSAKLKLRYSNPMIGGLAQTIEGTKETLQVFKEGTENYVELAFNELNEAAYLYMEIDTNSAFGIMKHTIRVQIDESTLKKDGVAVTPEPIVTPSPVVTPSPTESPVEEGTIKDGFYETKVYLWHASNDQASMAASAVNGTARILVRDGIGTIYLYTKQMTLGTITAHLQELKVETATGTYQDAKVETKDAKGNPTCFSFTLPSFEEYVAIKVNPHVAIMGDQDIDARLKIEYTALKEVEQNDLTEAPVETKAPSSTATEKPQATVEPTVKPTANPATPSATKTPEAATEETEASSETSTTWNDTTETSDTEEPEEAEEMEEETVEEESEQEEAEEMLPETGEQQEDKTANQTTKEVVATKDHTPLMATAAASAGSFLTSLVWAIRLRFQKR